MTQHDNIDDDTNNKLDVEEFSDIVLYEQVRNVDDWSEDDLVIIFETGKTIRARKAILQ